MPFNPPIPEPRRPGKPNGKPNGLFSAFIQAEKLIQVALVLPCAAFIGWLIGDWAGNRLHAPILGALGVALGGAAGLVYVVRLALDAVKEPGDKPGKGDRGSRS